MSQYGNKKYANTHKPSDFDSSEPVRYNQSRTGSTQTMTVCKNQATVRLHQAREVPHLWIVYLGFGAGLAVFIFTGVVKGIPSELEESAMIDGASVPRIFFQIVLPIMRPSLISVAILQTMWIWNDFLLPYLTLDMRRFKTMSIAIQYLKGGYGSVDMGAMMACLVVAIVPIIIFYLCCQKYIIKGVMAGAVKG